MKKPSSLRSIDRFLLAGVGRQPSPQLQTRRYDRLASRLRAALAVSALAALAVCDRSFAQVSLPSGPPYTTVSAANSGSVAIGDMNRDGKNDVVIGRVQNQNVQIVPGDGQGGFGTPVEFPAFPSSMTARPGSVVLGDINGDGNLDVVALHYVTSGALSVLYGDGAGNLGSPTVFHVYDTRNPADTRYVVWSAALGDVNRDSKPDLIVVGANNFSPSKGDVWVWLNDGAGNFSTPPTIVWTKTMGHGEVPAQFVAAGDLDGDGNGDIVVTTGFGQFGSGNAVTVLYGNGTGAFPKTFGRPFPAYGGVRANEAQDVDIADMDGDGQPDLVVPTANFGGGAGTSGAVTVFRNTGSRTFDAGTTYRTLFFRNGQSAVGDLNNDGYPDVVVTGASSGGSIAYLLNDGTGRLGNDASTGLGAGVFVGGVAVAFGLAVGDLTSSGPGTLDVVVGTGSAGTKLLQNGPAGPTAPPADTTPPVITVPANIVTEATGPSGAAVTFTATANDDVDGAIAVTANPPSGSTFPLGTTVVSLSAVDAAGNTASASFTVTVQDTTPPVISAPTAITAEATGPSGAAVSFVAVANDLVSGTVAVSANPPSGSTFPLGFSSVSLSASDAAGNTASGTILIYVRDTIAPTLTVPADQVLEATSAAGAAATFAATATDAVGVTALTYSTASGSTFPLGTTTVSVTAQDAAGNATSGSFSITVQDTTAPVISSLSASNATLWPPNHKMVPISLTPLASDAVGVVSLKIISATSSEPDNGLGDGDTEGDIEITGALTLNLRAERGGKGQGRVYTVTVEAHDAAGNASTRSVTISVPKNQGGK